MNKQEWMIGLIGFLLGIIITITVSSVYYNSHHSNGGFRSMWDMMDGQDENNYPNTMMD